MFKTMGLSAAIKMYGGKVATDGYKGRDILIPVGHKQRITFGEDYRYMADTPLGKIFIDAEYKGCAKDEHSGWDKFEWNINMSIDMTSWGYSFAYGCGMGYCYIAGKGVDGFRKWAARRWNANSPETLVRVHNQGIASVWDHVYIAPELPTTESVVSCLLMDASCYANTRDIDEFAEGLGYKSVKPTKIIADYEACRVAFNNLNDMLHTIGMSNDELSELFIDY